MTVGKLRWKAYKSIKQKVIDTLGGVIADVLRGGIDFSDPQSIQSALKKVLPHISNRLDELNEEFVLGCVDGHFDLSELTVNEMMKLFSECVEANPVEEFIELEKNSPAGSLLKSLLDSGNLPGVPSGTQPSNANVYDPAGESQS